MYREKWHPGDAGCRQSETENRAHAARTGFALQHAYSGGVSVGGHVPRDVTRPAARVGLSHTIVANNSISWTPVGVTVSPFARKSVLYGNTFEGVDQPPRRLSSWRTNAVDSISREPYSNRSSTPPTRR